MTIIKHFVLPLVALMATSLPAYAAGGLLQGSGGGTLGLGGSAGITGAPALPSVPAAPSVNAAAQTQAATVVLAMPISPTATRLTSRDAS